MADALVPSDVIKSATDEVGNSLAAIRAQALDASGADRLALFDVYKKLLRRLQKLMFRDLKKIDKDPEIAAVVQDLATLTQQIAKVKREMIDAKATIDSATKVLGFADDILKFLGKVGAIVV